MPNEWVNENNEVCTYSLLSGKHLPIKKDPFIVRVVCDNYVRYNRLNMFLYLCVIFVLCVLYDSFITNRFYERSHILLKNRNYIFIQYGRTSIRTYFRHILTTLQNQPSDDPCITVRHATSPRTLACLDRTIVDLPGLPYRYFIVHLNCQLAPVLYSWKVHIKGQ